MSATPLLESQVQKGDAFERSLTSGSDAPRRTTSTTSDISENRRSSRRISNMTIALGEGVERRLSSSSQTTATKARTSVVSADGLSKTKQYLGNAGLFQDSDTTSPVVLSPSHASLKKNSISSDADDSPQRNRSRMSIVSTEDLIRSAEEKQKLFVKGKSSVAKREWWQLNRESVHAVLIWMNGLFYWCYATYIVALILGGAVAMWAVAPSSIPLDFLDALYMAAACVSQSGLATVDWAKQATSVHVVSFCLILMGSMSLLTIVPALLRRHSFRMQLAVEESLHPGLHEHHVESIREDGDNADNLSQSSTDSFDLAAWELEYAALGYVVKIVLGYWLTVHLLAFSIMYFYIEIYGTSEIWSMFDEYGLKNHWHTMYLTLSSFQNNGLVLTESSIEVFAHHPTILCMVSALIFCGNTGLPIMIRCVTWLLWRLTPNTDRWTQQKYALGFFLEHPRRCYTHMFPGMHTLWLVLVFVALDGLPILVMLWQDGETSAYGPFEHYSDKVYNAMLQSVSARTAGVNSVDIWRLNIVSTFTLTVMMYIATTPTVVTMRYSQLAQGYQELDITGRAEGWENVEVSNTVTGQAKTYLTQDVTYLIVIVFFILVNESDKFVASSEQTSLYEDGIYNDYDFLKVIFEMASAYGTVGLSLGYRNAAYSFSGAWTRWSQFLLIVTMVLGRLRGLPDSVDPSVSTTMARPAGGSKQGSRQASKQSA